MATVPTKRVDPQNLNLKEQVVAINRFSTDTPAEIAFLEKRCAELDVKVALSEVFTRGGAGYLAVHALPRRGI